MRMRESFLKFVSPGGGGLRRLGADTVLYGGSRALAAAFALFTFPFVARILTPAELGQFAVIQMLTLLLVPIGGMGQDMAVMKFLSNDREDSNDSDVNVTSLAAQLFGILVSVLVACAIALAFSAQVTERLGWDLFAVVLVGIPAGVLFSSALNLSKFRFLRSVFLGISLLQVVLYTVSLVLSVIVLRSGVYGYALSTAGALLAASAVGLYLLRGEFLGGRLSWGLGRAMLVFGAPYVLVGLLMVLLPFLDRLVLTWRATDAEIGIYSVAIRYVGLLEMGLIGFKMAWWPFAFSSYSASGDTGLFGRALTAYVIAAGCIVAGLYALSEFGVYVMGGESYAGAAPYVLPLLMARFVRGLQVVVGVGIAISGRSLWAPGGFLVGVAVGLAAALVLWPTLGIVSVAWGVFAGEFAAFLMTAMISQRFLPLRWQFEKVLGLAVLLLAYLGMLGRGIIPNGPVQIILFLLVYLVVGWYTLRGARPAGS